MADAPDNAVDRLDAWLNADGHAGDGDDLTDFAGRVLRDAALPDEPATEPTREQQSRIRARALGGGTTQARTPMHAHALSPNGSTPAPPPIGRVEQPAPGTLSILATAALVAIIALAAFGLLRGSIDLTPGSDDPNPTTQPALAYSPVASPTTAITCNRDQWISVFKGPVPDLLSETTHATLDDGTLTLHCGGESEELATGVRHASGAFWPGVIALVTEDDTVRLLNIANDTSLDLGSDLLNDDGEMAFGDAVFWSAGPEPWLITLTDADPTDWRITDLRSLESFLLSDELGESLPRSFELHPRSFKPVFGHITGTDVAVVTWRSETPYLTGTPIGGGSRIQADEYALVLPGSIEVRRWIHFTQFRRPTNLIGGGYSQISTVSPDGSLIAYTTLTDSFEPVIRVEQAVSGDKLVDVPIDGIDIDTHFILAGRDPHLVYANGDTVRIYGLAPDAVREIDKMPGPDIVGFFPTSDPDIVLMSHNLSGTAITVKNVADPDAPSPFYNYVPPVFIQVFRGDELPTNFVHVGSDSLTDVPATIQLVDPSTGAALLESDPLDVHPVQVVSFNTYLRNGGTLAVVSIGYNRAVVLDAASGETWQIEAPIDDDRIWHFYLSLDGKFVTAYPEPPMGTTGVEEGDLWIAPLEPGAEWVPIQGAPAEASMMDVATPAG